MAQFRKLRAPFQRGPGVKSHQSLYVKLTMEMKGGVFDSWFLRSCSHPDLIRDRLSDLGQPLWIHLACQRWGELEARCEVEERDTLSRRWQTSEEQTIIWLMVTSWNHTNLLVKRFVRRWLQSVIRVQNSEKYNLKVSNFQILKLSMFFFRKYDTCIK